MNLPDVSLETLLEEVLSMNARVGDLTITGRLGSGGDIKFADFHCSDEYGNLSTPAIRAVKDSDRWYLSTYAGYYYIAREAKKLPTTIVKMLSNMTYCLTVPSHVLTELHVEGPFDATVDPQ